MYTHTRDINARANDDTRKRERGTKNSFEKEPTRKLRARVKEKNREKEKMYFLGNTTFEFFSGLCIIDYT